MKKLLLLLLFAPILFLISCSSGSSEVAPNIYSVEGVWDVDSYLFNGQQMLTNDLEISLLMCEEDNSWALTITDYLGGLSAIAGSYSITNDQSGGIFTSLYLWDDYDMVFYPMTASYNNVTINKLDINELDITVEDEDGNIEIIKTVKTLTDPCGSGMLTNFQNN